eukprot:2953365-Pyramimonas_sp.AAC.1
MVMRRNVTMGGESTRWDEWFGWCEFIQLDACAEFARHPTARRMARCLLSPSRVQFAARICRANFCCFAAADDRPRDIGGRYGLRHQ